ncbi:MAG TPA: rhomboid family intramembrane serine protease [Solirubrobacteraceae bacterium]|nr:rhomboid family intramembrane serine protease [Solirubrobacteraceae bacterium]
MTATMGSLRRGTPNRKAGRSRAAYEGLVLLGGIVALMWIIEVINTLDGNGLDRDGLYPRNVDRLWGILTSPFIHGSFQHLFDNTIPFVFLGVLIALRGAVRLAIVTGLVIVLGGLGTWVISPAGVPTIGASGVVFGYATYLLARGFFDRSFRELLVGALVGLLWGAALFSSLIPHPGISWQAHLCGAIAGVIVAKGMSDHDRRRARTVRGSGPAAGPALPS